MRELIEFEKSDGHIALGHNRWVDFLETSEYSPMTKNQYYDRKDVFEKENPDVWDRLTDLGIPISLRKRLPEGAFEIKGDSIVITGEDGSTQSVGLADANRTQVIETIKILHDSILEKTKKLAKGKDDYRKLKEKYLESEESGGSAISPIDKAHMVACGALSALADQLADLTRENCQTYLDGPFNLLITQMQRVNNGLCEKLELESLDVDL
jgi:hypothetical protein